jgi:hypothetical protein
MMSLKLAPRAHRRLALITTQLATLAQPPSAAAVAQQQQQQQQQQPGECAAPAVVGAAGTQGQLTPLVERIHAFTKASNTRVAIMATGAGSVRPVPPAPSSTRSDLRAP